MERKYIDASIKSISHAKSKQLVFLSTEDNRLDGRRISINGCEKINFGSCSYLGLEQDKRVKQGAIDAINQFGTQYSSSRTYVSLGLYQELEDLLSEIYGHTALVTPTTSLGHIATIPVLVGENDLVILDHQVHTSVRNAVQILRAQNIEVKTIRHNNMIQLQSRLEKSANKYEKVWYFADGVYSIFGDGLDHVGIKNLMSKFANFHVYIDDAHGNSWTGKRGKGYALSHIDYCDRIVVMTSLNKSFAAGGGALICHNEELKELILCCGSTMIFSGPLQPPLLGAAVESAKIHLTSELDLMQADLNHKIQYFIDKSTSNGLPILDDTLTPIFFIGIGEYNMGIDLCSRMIDSGFYCNISAFPSVPHNNTGIRCTITRHLTLADIDNMIETLLENFSAVLLDHGQTIEDVHRNFKITPKVIRKVA